MLVNSFMSATNVRHYCALSLAIAVCFVLMARLNARRFKRAMVVVLNDEV
jgi:hypothetical protein